MKNANLKRLLGTVSAASLLLGVAAHTTTASTAASTKSPAPKSSPLSKWQQQQADKFKKSAPADEYFGRMKLSYIGINNTLRDQAIRSGDYTVDSDIINKAFDAEDALHDWQRKYPNDPQLARTLYLMGKLYAKIWTPYGQGQAAHYYQMLQSQFGSSYFGKLMKAQLAKGFTEHILADALPCPTPIPTETPTPEPRGRGRATPTPVPTATPSPSASPSPTPTPKPTPTPPPPNSNIKIVIVPVPCYTITPSPSPTPVVTPSVTPSSTPSVKPSVTPSHGPTPIPSPSAASVPTLSPTSIPMPTRPPVPAPSATPTPHHRK